MAELAREYQELSDALSSAFPDRWMVLLFELAPFLRERSKPSPFSCLVCGHASAAVGVTSGSNPFFGRVGGWDEAGGVRWLCGDCLRRAEHREKGFAPDPDAALADATRALREDSLLLAKLRAGHARDPAFRSQDGACVVCGHAGRVHGFPPAAICGACAAAGIRAAGGKAGTRDG